ncbi:MAG: hypothetical protein B6242_15200 [Anaerolineaceae bacterium 4572_78]|nr:MAG: hypothetical protein B6242_15200 [Anaerolineaceae bacterium 4572_78]
MNNKPGKCDEAIEKYERALENNPEDAKTWNNYGNALSDLGKYNEAIEKYEHALLINPEYANAWYNYGTTLSNSGKYNKAIEKYEHALEINDEDANAWNNYGNALADLGRYNEAIEKYEHALEINDEDANAWNNYGNALAALGRYNEAIEKYEHARQTPDFPKYAGRIMIFLGSLYYRTKQQKKGQQCFEWLIEHVGAGDKDAVRLRTAHEILATDSENEYAIDILEQITAESPQYKESSHTLALVVSPKKFWDMFRPGSKHHLKNTQQLDHSLYHKFAGEMGLLKVIVHSIKRYSHQNGTMPTEVDEQLTNLIEQVEMMNREMLDRRQAEKTKIREIPHDNYRAMLQVISDSAHDMADFINNQLAILEADVRYILRTLPADHAYRDYFSELLTQAELTQRALNDLKAVNEGIVIRHSRFRVHDIFVKWLETPQISNAHITIDVSKNGQDMMVGDLEKIRSMLSELVNNSLKHNRDKTDLRITMTTNET